MSTSPPEEPRWTPNAVWLRWESPGTDEGHTQPSTSPSEEPRWLPDEKTLHWAFGIANENRIQDAIRDDVRSRGEGLESSSAEYWNLVAEVAIEAVLYDLVEQAKKLGSYPSADADGSSG